MNLEEAIIIFGIDDITSESEESLKKKYKKMMIKYHPDNIGGDETKAKEISLAFDILKDALLKIKRYNSINIVKEQYNIVIPLNKLISIYNGGTVTIGSGDDKKVFGNKDIQKYNTIILLDTTIVYNGQYLNFSNVQHWSISDNYVINCDIIVNNLNDTETVIIKLENIEKEISFKSQAISIKFQLEFNISVEIKINKKLQATRDNNAK